MRISLVEKEAWEYGSTLTGEQLSDALERPGFSKKRIWRGGKLARLMVRRYRDELTLSELAGEFGVCLERVRHLLLFGCRLVRAKMVEAAGIEPASEVGP